jgi:[ribosomal protein S18]-alanine N-acetyltransferase
LIRPIEERDLNAVLAIQSICPEIAQWTSWDYIRVIQGEMAGWVAVEDGIPLGFLVARRIVSELEILNFAVRPDARGRGIGTHLLHQAFTWGEMFEAGQALLEVRASNVAALRFYESRGFSVSGRRKDYYAAPVEDALVLMVSLR